MIDLSDITRELIDGICREDTLLDWHDAAYDRYDETKVQYNMNRLAGQLTPAWEHGARGNLAQMDMLMRRIERRLSALGFAVPLTRRTKRNDMIRNLESKLCEANQTIRALKAQVRSMDV